MIIRPVRFFDPYSWCLLYLWFFDNFSCKCFCSYRDIFTEINCYTAIVICAAVTRDPSTVWSTVGPKNLPILVQSSSRTTSKNRPSLVRRSLPVIVFSGMIFVESGFTAAECWNLCHQKIKKKSNFFRREPVPISVRERNSGPKMKIYQPKRCPKGFLPLIKQQLIYWNKG